MQLSVSFFLSFYLQYIKGFSPAVAGTILVTRQVVQTLFSSYTGRISDRIEPGRIASAGMVFDHRRIVSSLAHFC